MEYSCDDIFKEIENYLKEGEFLNYSGGYWEIRSEFNGLEHSTQSVEGILVWLVDRNSSDEEEKQFNGYGGKLSLRAENLADLSALLLPSESILVDSQGVSVIDAFGSVLMSFSNYQKLLDVLIERNSETEDFSIGIRLVGNEYNRKKALEAITQYIKDCGACEEYSVYEH